MTQEGFREYTFSVYGKKNGTASSYLKAIRILDDIFAQQDVFALNGQPLSCVDNIELLINITDFIRLHEGFFREGKESIFRFGQSDQTSYPKKRFCSGAMAHLLRYYEYCKVQEAVTISKTSRSCTAISKKLIKHFDLNKEGNDAVVQTKQRIGQDYFRKMVLVNYDNKCCVTGLNVPIVLRASHISAWAEDKVNRMNPENGLCLSATYDAAFDKHLISFDDDYRMIVSKEIKEYYTAEVTKEYFQNFEGKQITMPSQFLPSKQLLEKHRELMVG